MSFDRGLELLLGQLDRAAHMGHAHIVVQNIDAAEMRDCLRNRRFDGGIIGDVRRDRDRLSTFVRDDGGGFLRRFAHEIDAGDPRALARIGHRRRLAVTPAGSRGTGSEHDGRSSLQTVDHDCLQRRNPARVSGASDPKVATFGPMRCCDRRDPPAAKRLMGADQLRLLPTAFSRIAQASSPYFFFHSA